MSKHYIRLTVSFFMDEMDGEPEESAEIAMGIMDNLLREHTAWEECDTRTHACYEVMS